MALDLGTLAFKLKADDSAVDSTLRGLPAKGRRAGQELADGFTRDASGRLRDARGRFARTGQAIGHQMGMGARAGLSPALTTLGTLFAGLGIAHMTGEVLGFGMRTAMVMEKANISFTTLLGSGERAQAFMTRLKKFAATTPFEFTELQGSASQLLAAGISASKVIPIMTTLGNVTSGMGTGSEGIQRAVIALQQMNAAGKITGEDLNQLRDAGIPVYDLLAAATGRSKAEIVKLAQAGKLGGKDLAAMMKALETGKGLERFNGLMDKQSQSLEGVISTLKDTVGQGLADALTPMMPDIKKGIADFTAALPGILSAVQGFFGFIRDNQEMLKALGAGLLAAGIALGVVTAAQWLLNAALTANPIGIVVMAIAALVAGLVWAYNNVGWFRTMADAAFKVIGAAAMWLWTNAIQPAFAAIGDFARWLWNSALQPFVKASLVGFAMLVRGVANMLEALSSVPGFEWAKDASKGLRELATSAEKASWQVGKIPDPKVDTKDSQKQVSALDKKIKALKDKKVTAKAKGDSREVDRLNTKIKALERQKHEIKTTVNTAQATKKVDALQSKLDKLNDVHINVSGFSGKGGMGGGGGGAWASGGRFSRGMWGVVGEMGPELVQWDGSGYVHNASDTKKMLTANSGRGSVGMPGGQTPISVSTTINGANYDQAERLASTVVAKVASAQRLASAGFGR